MLEPFHIHTVSGPLNHVCAQIYFIGQYMWMGMINSISLEIFHSYSGIYKKNNFCGYG